MSDQSAISTIWESRLRTLRNLTAFWVFGLSNNFGYVTMLSGAYDILDRFDVLDSISTGNDFIRNCNSASTGAILLATIIPSFVIKIISPFIPLYINIRMAAVVITAAAGLILVALGPNKIVIIFGVALVSFGSGLGESSLLAYTTFFKTRNVISTWSSGTGAAGLVGSFAYSLLVQIGLKPEHTILVMTIMPLVMALSFWLLLDRPRIESVEGSLELEPPVTVLLLKDKFNLIPYILVHYTIAYGLVYFFEYFINQGLFELLQFPNTFLSTTEQYRWYNTIYQAGVFLCRSSMNILHIDVIWALAILQLVNTLVLLFEVLFGYIFYLPIVMVIILWEGLIGGAAYVNTFRRIASEMPTREREFSMALNSIGDSITISFAGLLAIPVHDLICNTEPTYKST